MAESRTEPSAQGDDNDVDFRSDPSTIKESAKNDLLALGTQLLDLDGNEQWPLQKCS